MTIDILYDLLAGNTTNGFGDELLHDLSAIDHALEPSPSSASTSAHLDDELFDEGNDDEDSFVVSEKNGQIKQFPAKSETNSIFGAGGGNGPSPKIFGHNETWYSARRRNLVATSNGFSMRKIDLNSNSLISRPPTKLVYWFLKLSFCLVKIYTKLIAFFMKQQVKNHIFSQVYAFYGFILHMYLCVKAMEFNTSS